MFEQAQQEVKPPSVDFNPADLLTSYQPYRLKIKTRAITFQTNL